MLLVLPGTLEWEIEMRHLPPPPGWMEQAHKTSGEVALIAPLGGNGLMELVSLDRAMEYAYDGELAARQEELVDVEEEDDPLIWLPGDF